MRSVQLIGRSYPDRYFSFMSMDINLDDIVSIFICSKASHQFLSVNHIGPQNEFPVREYSDRYVLMDNKHAWQLKGS